ncbi:hypothetical protein GEMRC1_003714 [Eukaryota sp. GEM-RC1]
MGLSDFVSAVGSIFSGKPNVETILSDSFPLLPQHHVRTVLTRANGVGEHASHILSRHHTDLNALMLDFPHIDQESLTNRFLVHKCSYSLTRSELLNQSPANGHSSSVRNVPKRNNRKSVSLADLNDLSSKYSFLPPEHIESICQTYPKNSALTLLMNRNRDVQSLFDKFKQHLDHETIWKVYFEKNFNKDMSETRLKNLKISKNPTFPSQNVQKPAIPTKPKPSTSHPNFSVESDHLNSYEIQELTRLFEEFPTLDRPIIEQLFKDNYNLYHSTKRAINQTLVFQNSNSKLSPKTNVPKKEPVAKGTRSQSSRHQGHVDDHYSKETVIVEEDSWKETTNYENHPDILAGMTIDNFEELLILEQRLTMTLAVFKETLPPNSLESHKGFRELQELVSSAKQKISGLISGSLSANSRNLIETCQLLEVMQRKNLKKVLEINCTDNSNNDLLIALESNNLNVLPSPFCDSILYVKV